MTKVGFNLLAWSAVVSEEMLPIAERLKEIGYDGIECFLGAEDEETYRWARGERSWFGYV